MTQLILATEYLHDQRILHRDIKAGNVFLKLCEGKLSCVLGDLGSSKALTEQSSDLAKTTIGTPH